MNTKRHRHLADLVRQCDPKVILAAAGHCDGHSIMSPQAFLDAGLPADVVAHLTRTYKSDGSPKGTLFVAGQPVKQLEGVYGLDMLRFLGVALDVEYRQALGRGFEAANIRTALIEHFQAKPETTQPS